MSNHRTEDRIKSFERKQYIVSVSALVMLVGLAIVLNALHLQSAAEENTRFLSRMIKIGDFREASLILQEARLSNFTEIRYESEVPGRSFILPPKAELLPRRDWWRSVLRDAVTVPVSVGLQAFPSDFITFEFSRLRLVPHSALIWFLLNLISIPQSRYFKRRLKEQFKRDLELETKAAKSEVAQQVRHDLRTPLAALMRVPPRIPDSSAKERHLLDLTIGQIRELISKLDDEPDSSLSLQFENHVHKTLVLAKSELELIIPKNIHFQFYIDDMIVSALVPHIPFELRAVLGNLVANAIDAFNPHERGNISVDARDLGAEIEIVVADSGRGISSENLPHVFLKGISFDKPHGSGLGLSHAKEQIESWGGRISLESSRGSGTFVRATVPIKDRASWFVPRLKFDRNSRILILDDQESARGLWLLKLSESGLLHQAEIAEDWRDVPSIHDQITLEPERYTLLFDHDLGTNVTGLELLKSLPKASKRYLVTGHFDRSEIQEECSRHGLYLIPKPQIPDLALVVR